MRSSDEDTRSPRTATRTSEYTIRPRDRFRADVERGVEVVETVTGRRPTGYRAPAFSITRKVTWAYEVLADLGFRYDASQHDSPRIPTRIGGIPTDPYRLRLPSGRSLIELPVAVFRWRNLTLPVGGGIYWRILPGAVLTGALRHLGSRWASLYVHPYECDTAPLAVPLPATPTLGQRAHACWLDARYRVGRRRIPTHLLSLASHFQMMGYDEAVERIERDPGTCTRSLSQAGDVV